MNHANRGFLGTWYLLKAITLLDRPDVTLRIVTNSESPSWATMLKQTDAATVPDASRSEKNMPRQRKLTMRFFSL